MYKGHDQLNVIDSAKSNSKLGYKPDESSTTGIDKAIKWYLDNEDWWRHIMSDEYQDWINQQYEK
jgi:dTDP-glucose 4,6-dehydratase